MNKKLNIWIFLFLFAIYSIASSFLFVATSAGWTALWVIIISLIYFSLVFIISFVTSIILQILHKDRIVISLIGLFTLFIIQINALLFNVFRDCGDMVCRNSSFFLKDLFHLKIPINSNFMMAYGQASSVVYCFFLIIFLYFTYRTASSKNNIKNESVGQNQ
ncbi:MAG: hypothetical protein UV67_C0030G0006 [Parcubacteria group bacterium GW2011_GWC1_43_12]|nr:MAG: hypothetical protein UV34_C0029G0006 [Parcubacteria group bacterium GW2011_GWB1_42_6]KKS91365.1 MAG: hypothetical protein UV67_C0030G0006 [Parcubacteria group bacterium GW2011_GWC1_43_12]